MKTHVILLSAVSAALAMACGSGSVARLGRVSSDLEATAGCLSSGAPITQAECEARGKAFICHVPPGNPANAHTLCISKCAVPAHLANHPDSLGACKVADDGGKVVDDSGTPPGSTAPPGSTVPPDGSGEPQQPPVGTDCADDGSGTPDGTNSGTDGGSSVPPSDPAPTPDPVPPNDGALG